MNSLSLSRTTRKDFRARSLVAKFYVGKNFAYGVPGRRCTQIVECFGEPSHATAEASLREIARAANWDQNGTVALNAGGPAGQIKLFSRASCGIYDRGSYIPLVNGWVIDVGHHLRTDSVSWRIFDDRHIMTKYLCFGRMVVERSESGAAHFFQSNPSDPLIFNKDGHGDRIAFGGGFRFSTGRRVGQVVSETSTGGDYPTGRSTSQAGLWTCSQIIEYLRDFFTDNGRPNLGQDYGEMKLPETIKWPRGLGSKFKYDRTPNHMALGGMDLLSALRRVVQYAGPYDIHLVPISDRTSELRIVDFNPTDKTGSSMYTARYLGANLDECATNPCIIWDGVITESARKTFPGGTVLVGDAPATEIMASTDTSVVDGLGGLGYMQNGWISAEETTAKSKLEDSTTTPAGTPNEDNFNSVTERYPNVWNWYKLNAKTNPFATTKWSRLPIGGTMAIKTNQLTSFNENASSPLGLVSREVVVECKLADHEYSGLSATEQERGWWRFAGKFPGYQLSPCRRYVAIPGLRSLTLLSGTATAYPSVSGQSVYDKAYITPRKMRFQLACEHNQAMVVRAGKSDERDTTGTMHRVDKTAPKFTCQIINEPLHMIDWTRTSKSYPCGRGGITPTKYAQLGWAAQFPARQTAGNELMTDYVNSDTTNPKNRMPILAELHNQNFKRVDYQGVVEFAQLTAAWRVGMQVTVEVDNVIGKVSGMVRCVSWSDASNHTQVDFGPNEIPATYDGPIAIQSGNNGGQSIGASGGGGGESYDSGGGGSEPSYDNSTTSANTPSYSSSGDSPATYTSSNSSIASGGDTQASGSQPSQVEETSDNSADANNQAIKNNPTAAGMRGARGANGAAGAAGAGKKSGKILVDRQYDAIDSVARNELKESAGLLAGKGNNPTQDDFEFAIRQRYGKDADTNAEMERLGLGGFDERQDVSGSKKGRGVYKTNEDGFERRMKSLTPQNNKGRGIYMGGERQTVDRRRRGNQLG